MSAATQLPTVAVGSGFARVDTIAAPIRLKGGKDWSTLTEGQGVNRQSVLGNGNLCARKSGISAS